MNTRHWCEKKWPKNGSLWDSCLLYCYVVKNTPLFLALSITVGLLRLELSRFVRDLWIKWPLEWSLDCSHSKTLLWVYLTYSSLSVRLSVLSLELWDGSVYNSVKNITWNHNRHKKQTGRIWEQVRPPVMLSHMYTPTPICVLLMSETCSFVIIRTFQVKKDRKALHGSGNMLCWVIMSIVLQTKAFFTRAL